MSRTLTQSEVFVKNQFLSLLPLEIHTIVSRANYCGILQRDQYTWTLAISTHSIMDAQMLKPVVPQMFEILAGLTKSSVEGGLSFCQNPPDGCTETCQEDKGCFKHRFKCCGTSF